MSESMVAGETPATDTMEARKAAARDWFAGLQERIIASLEALENESKGPFPDETGEPGRFAVREWTRADRSGAPGGGGRMAILKGRVFEKAGVHFSCVHGSFAPEFAKMIPGAADDPRFWASGVSIICHPWNPHAPTAHANVRFIVTTKSGFGGGADLTPMLDGRRHEADPDAVAFHAAMRNACERNPGVAEYGALRDWCDRYFHLAHRDEKRGVGGIFFEHLNSAGDAGQSRFDEDFAFTRDVGEAFLRAYPGIMRVNMGKPWSEAERREQCIRRGRYVEFNLLYDRGTTFGLKTGGNVEAILSSMPPTVLFP